MKSTAKKLFSVLLAGAMAFSLLPMTAFAAENPIAINEKNFPDDTFRAYVQENFDGIGDQEADGFLDADEIAMAMEINISGSDAADLTGIQYFTNLIDLYCSGCRLTSLNVRANTALNVLDCSGNQIRNLDVSQNTELESLYCRGCDLTTLDISHNPALLELNCADNGISSLNMADRTGLVTLICGDNKLTALDVSQDKALTILYCGGNKLGTLDLTENAKLINLDCHDDGLTELDVSQNPNLEYLVCYASDNPDHGAENRLKELSVSANVNLFYLDCSGNPLSGLDMSGNQDLEVLDCSKTGLASLDMSKNPTLYELYCTDNQLTELDVSANTELEVLLCDNNQLTELDVSANTELEVLHCTGNPLKSLDISANTALTETGIDETVTVIYPKSPFSDVTNTGSYYYMPVIWANSLKITGGYEDSTFRPNTACSRAQVVTFLWRAWGSPEPETTENPFTDVKEGTYYYKAVLWAVENNITAGYSDGTFRPMKTVTRGQFVTFLWRFAGRPVPDSSESSFTDVKNSNQYYYYAVLWAAENGVTTGYENGTFRPDGTCTRANVVTFLYRAAYLFD